MPNTIGQAVIHVVGLTILWIVSGAFNSLVFYPQPEFGSSDKKRLLLGPIGLCDTIYHRLF